MATVPRADFTQATQPQRLVYGDPNAARGAFTSPIGQLAEAGEQLQRTADSLIEAQLRIQERNDAVARARDFLPFQAFGRESLTALQSTDDIANPTTVQKYRQMLDDKATEILTSHQGSEISRQALETRLLEQKLEFMDTAAVASTTAGRKAVQDQLGVDLGAISARVAADPTRFNEELDNWSKSLENMKPVLTPEEERAWQRQGPAVMVEAILDGMLTQPNGDIEVQRLISSTPGLMALMEPAQQVEVRKRIQMVAQANAAERNKTYTLGRDQVLIQNGRVVARGPVSPPPKTQAQEVAETLGLAQALGLQVDQNMLSKLLGFGDLKQSTADKLHEFETLYAARNNGELPPPEISMKFLGVDTTQAKTLTQTISEVQAIRAKNGQAPLTDEQLNTLQGIGKSDRTFGEKVAEVETVVGPLSREELATFGGFAVKTPDEKPTFDDDNLAIMTDLSARYAADNTTDEEDRAFETAVTNYVQPPSLIEPTTGTITLGEPKVLPAHVQRALEARGYRIPFTTGQDLFASSGEAGAQQRQGQPQPGQQGAIPTQPGQRPGPTVEAAQQQPQPSPATTQQQQQVQPSEVPANEPAATLFEQAPLLTGPVATVGPGIGQAPVPGLAGTFGQETQTQASFNLSVQELISAIRDARYYNPTEETRLREEVAIEGKFWDNTQSFQNRIIGIDTALERRADNALKTIQSERTTRDERRKAIEVLNAIENFRRILMPPRMNSPAEAALFARENPGVKVLIPDGQGGWVLKLTPPAVEEQPASGR